MGVRLLSFGSPLLPLQVLLLMGGGATSRGSGPLDDPVGFPHTFPLCSWRELLGVKEKNVRTNSVRVESEPLLFKLGDATSRLR